MAVAPEEETVDEGITAAIEAGAKAGIFRRAQRLNKQSAATWGRFADEHSAIASAFLTEAVDRLGACGPGPCRRLGD